MPPRLEIQSNPCFTPYGKQLLEAVLSSQEARQTRPCPALPCPALPWPQFWKQEVVGARA